VLQQMLAVSKTVCPTGNDVVGAPAAFFVLVLRLELWANTGEAPSNSMVARRNNDRTLVPPPLPSIIGLKTRT